MDYCDVLSAVWSLILTAPIHCRGSIGVAILDFFISVLMKKQTPLHLGWPEDEYILSQVTFIYIAPLTIQIVTKHCRSAKQIFIFGRTIPLTIIISGL